jgi:glycerophosphoryl diester phosphodiesterase
LFDGVNAHRGGPNSGGVASYPENSLEAFKAAHELRVDVVELDVKLTADNVPVVMHDATLDRTTNCTGQVRQVTAAALASNCRIDTVGGEALLRPAAPPGVRIPTLAETLVWADDENVKLNLEIKNYPTDPDYSPGPGFANTVLTVIESGDLLKRRVLIQSFLPQNLDPAKARGFPTALLSLQQIANEAAIETARANGYDVIQPGWPTAIDPKQFIDSAHRAGLAVIPYTIDDEAEIRRAFDLGVDGLISNDTALAMRTRYAPLCRTAKRRVRRARATLNKRKRAYRRAQRGTARHRKLRRRVRSARKSYARAKRNRNVTCAKAAP